MHTKFWNENFKRSLLRSTHRSEIKIQMNYKKIGDMRVGRIELGQDRVRGGSFKQENEHSHLKQNEKCLSI